MDLLSRTFDNLFESEKEFFCSSRGTWPCPEVPYLIDDFCLELISDLQVALHKEDFLEELYLYCAERFCIDIDNFEDDAVEFFFRFLKHSGFKVFDFKEDDGD